MGEKIFCAIVFSICEEKKTAFRRSETNFIPLLVSTLVK
jgi:hypothetical protein